ncbi:MAG: Ppx/GppA phosphatase family, partial [Acidimicrobiaceae bacterium]|nr:Ppx/GppA phosphatase family [Acidimicrobiaceae bacterium]
LAGGRDPVGRFVVDRLAGELEGPVAAIDLGTNSTRLLVLDPSGATLAREMTITRLGEGVDRTGRLAPAAIARTVAAIVAFREQAESFGAVRFRAAATSAAREAANAEDLAAAVDEALGTPLDILSGEEEGRLAYRGATVNIGTAGEPTLVVDVGGGSTELIAPALDGSGVVAVSLPIGCVRVSERFLASDPPSQDQLLEARSAIRALLVGALDGQPALRAPRRMIGVAGTVAALVGLKLGAEVSDRARLHGAKLTRDEVERLGADLAAEPIRLRRERPGLEPERADVIVGGALVLSEVLAATGHFALEHSESDLLDAMAAGLLSDEPGATA